MTVVLLPKPKTLDTRPLVLAKPFIYYVGLKTRRVRDRFGICGDEWRDGQRGREGWILKGACTQINFSI